MKYCYVANTVTFLRIYNGCVEMGHHIKFLERLLIVYIIQSSF